MSFPVFISISVSISQPQHVQKVNYTPKTPTTFASSTNVMNSAMFSAWNVGKVQSGMTWKKLVCLWAQGKLVLMVVMVKVSILKK